MQDEIINVQLLCLLTSKVRNLQKARSELYRRQSCSLVFVRAEKLYRYLLVIGHVEGVGQPTRTLDNRLTRLENDILTFGGSHFEKA